MPNIKPEILENLRILFQNHGLNSVEGTYDYPNGELTFNFSDGDVVTAPFVYKGDGGAGAYSESGFKVQLSDTGGKIIQTYNQKYLPDALAEFMSEITE